MEERLAQLQIDGDYYEFDNRQWAMDGKELFKIAQQYFDGMETLNGDTCEVKLTGRQFAILASYFLHCERP